MNKTKSKIISIALCALFAALIAVGAFIRIPLPVVPFTLQVMFVILAGLLLGPRLGAISALCYIAVGLLGLPVFAEGGGIGYVLKPSFGYLIGFAVGAAITGMIAKSETQPTVKRLLAASFAGLGAVYLIGIVYYYIICNYVINAPIGVWPLILHCFLLVIPGDIVTCVVCALMAKRLIPAINRIR